MELQVFDTYVKGKNGEIHIDILVPKGKDINFALDSGKKFLKTINEEGAELTTKECRFCHITDASEIHQKEVETQGYAIIKMSGC